MGKGGNLCFCENMKAAEHFFEVDNLVDVCNMITDNSEYWKRKYYEHQDRPEISPARNSGVKSESRKAFNKHSLGLLISLVEDGKQFEYFSMTKSLLFALSCSAFWVEILNAIQEVCKERTILRREYMTGLHLCKDYGILILFVIGFAVLSVVVLHNIRRQKL